MSRGKAFGRPFPGVGERGDQGRGGGVCSRLRVFGALWGREGSEVHTWSLVLISWSDRKLADSNGRVLRREMRGPTQGDERVDFSKNKKCSRRGRNRGEEEKYW